MNKMFVYGSLKNGFGNNHLLMNSKFVRKDLTKEPTYTMFSFGGFPGIVRGESCISGELYEVDDDTLSNLDALESNGSFYQRELVKLDGGGEAWMYLTLGGNNPVDNKTNVSSDNNVDNWG